MVFDADVISIVSPGAATASARRSPPRFAVEAAAREKARARGGERRAGELGVCGDGLRVGDRAIA